MHEAAERHCAMRPLKAALITCSAAATPAAPLAVRQHTARRMSRDGEDPPKNADGRGDECGM
eukprot:3209445-Rhodomonas_salina.1